MSARPWPSRSKDKTLFAPPAPKTQGVAAALPTLVFAVASLLLFKLYLAVLTAFEWFPSLSVIALPVMLAITAVASLWCKNADLSRPLSSLTRGIALACLLYSGLLFPGVPVVAHNPMGLGPWLLPLGWLLALVAAIASWWRPAWLLFCGFYIFWVKNTAGYLTGLTHHSLLDVLPLYQMAGYLGIAATLTALTPRLLRRSRFKAVRLNPSFVVIFVAVAMQATNYYIASLAKAKLDGGYLDWALNNQNQNILSVALHNKQLFWGEVSWLVAGVTTAFVALARPMALGIFAAQLAAIAALSNKRLLLFLFASYDLLHLGIFALVGANFWPWFMINLALIAAVSQLPASAFNVRAGIAGLALMLVMPLVTRVVWLGWYDTRAVNTVYFEAIDNAGTRTRVPGTFFGLYSYPIAHMSFGLPPGQYVPTVTNGGTFSSLVQKESLGCRFTSTHSPLESVWNPKALSGFVRGYHHYVVAKASINGHWSQVWYPHHFWSAPSVERAFAQVDLRVVKQYALVVQSACVNADGSVDKELFKNEYLIHVDAP
jgi:hypothetical protein